MKSQGEVIDALHDEEMRTPSWVNLALSLKTWTDMFGKTYVEGNIYRGEKRWPTKAQAEEATHN